MSLGDFKLFTKRQIINHYKQTCCKCYNSYYLKHEKYVFTITAIIVTTSVVIIKESPMNYVWILF